jgi:hypothetical protein
MSDEAPIIDRALSMISLYITIIKQLQSLNRNGFPESAQATMEDFLRNNRDFDSEFNQTLLEECNAGKVTYKAACIRFIRRKANLIEEVQGAVL